MHLNFAIQGILTAVLSTVLGTKDQEQVATMAKQAGEVSEKRTSLSAESLSKHTFQKIL